VETVQWKTRSQPSGEIKRRTSGIDEPLFAAGGDVSEVSATIGRDRET
jgi:hypothetical protein